MALISTPYQSSDEKMQGTTAGINMFPAGCVYIQYGATAEIASSTTATSVFTNTTAKTVNYNYIGGDPTKISSLILPANSLGIGTVIMGKIVGSIKNNSSTPNLTFTSGLNNGSAYTAISTTGAKAMISTASYAYVELGWEWVVTAIGASGIASMFGKSYWKIVSTAGVPLMFDGDPAQTFGSFDTTIANTIDAQITWGTSHANNSCIPKYGYVQIIG